MPMMIGSCWVGKETCVFLIPSKRELISQRTFQLNEQLFTTHTLRHLPNLCPLLINCQQKYTVYKQRLDYSTDINASLDSKWADFTSLLLLLLQTLKSPLWGFLFICLIWNLKEESIQIAKSSYEIKH